MIIWESEKLPDSDSLNDECNDYYLVKVERYGAKFAMYIDGEWWTDYTSKLMVKVIGWTEIN